MDTETLGLDPAAPIWEFAAVRRSYDEDGSISHELHYHCFIKHRPGRWLKLLPEQFQQDYLSRYHREDALSRRAALKWVIHPALDNAHVVGAVPSFDTTRIERLMRGTWWQRLLGWTSVPSWNYHLIDIENVIAGFLHHAGERLLTDLPWRSNDLSKSVGVDPEDYSRHTAMGDVEWVRAQFDVLGSDPLPSKETTPDDVVDFLGKHSDGVRLNAVIEELGRRAGTLSA